MSDLLGTFRQERRLAWKRWLLAALASLITGFVCLNFVAYRQAYAMMHFSQAGARTTKPEKLSLPDKIKILFTGVNLPRPGTAIRSEEAGSGFRSMRIQCSKGIVLGAWYCPSDTNSPLVILFHGYGGEKSGTIAEARAFLEMRLSVLMVDFRGSGESSESYTTVGFLEADDVAASVVFARENLHFSKMILYGQSMGAAAVLRAIHSCAVQPDGVIIEAVFDKMLHTVRHRFEAMGVPSFPSAELLIFWGGIQHGFNGFRHNPVDYAVSLHCPTLFVHGATDPRARIKEARRVCMASPSQKLFSEFPDVGHESCLHRNPEQWREGVGWLLNKIPHSQ